VASPPTHRHRDGVRPPRLDPGGRPRRSGSVRQDHGPPRAGPRLADVEQGRAAALAVSKVDRLSRRSFDFVGLLERNLVALDVNVDTTTPQGEMMASVMAIFAQLTLRLGATSGIPDPLWNRLGQQSDTPVRILLP